MDGLRVYDPPRRCNMPPILPPLTRFPSTFRPLPAITCAVAACPVAACHPLHPCTLSAPAQSKTEVNHDRPQLRLALQRPRTRFKYNDDLPCLSMSSFVPIFRSASRTFLHVGIRFTFTHRIIRIRISLLHQCSVLVLVLLCPFASRVALYIHPSHRASVASTGPSFSFLVSLCTHLLYTSCNDHSRTYDLSSLTDHATLSRYPVRPCWTS